MTEMGRLKSALEREYEGLTENPVKIFNPKNLETITFHFRGEKMAKVGWRIGFLIGIDHNFLFFNLIVYLKRVIDFFN